MARINQWAFRGQILNSQYVRIRQMVGPFSLPPLRGSDWITYGHTGELFVPKVHGGRDIQLELIVRDVPYGIAPIIFDQLSLLFANRAQGSLANILDSGTRTGQAECTSWVPADTSVGGTTFVGTATFHLADPWLYGPTVTGSVTPTSTIAFGVPVVTPTGTVNPYTLALSGVVSGQPVMVANVTVLGAGVISSITDTFGGHYTWTKVDGDASSYNVELWIGTGGTGTSGNVVVTVGAGGTPAGAAIPMLGASASAGLAAIDVHGHGHGTISGTVWPPMTATLTPGAAGEAALFIWGDFGGDQGVFPVGPGLPWANVGFPATPKGDWEGIATEQCSPASGVALTPVWVSTYQGNGPYGWAGAIIKTATGAPVTLTVTNSGTALAEGIALDLLGPIYNPIITNTTNGTALMFVGTVAAGTHLLIDTGVYTCTNNGANAIGSLTHSGAAPFLTLSPGVNVLSVAGASCTGATLLTVSFHPPYE